MTKQEISWDVLARIAYEYEEYELEGTKVGSRGQEQLEGYIIEVDYNLDSSDICYKVDWGYGREEWVSRDEFYRIATEDSKELINPQTDKLYSESRYAEEIGWYKYGKSLNKKAHYQKYKPTVADKLLWKDEQILKVSKKIEHIVEQGKDLVRQGMKGSNEHIALENEYKALSKYLLTLSK